MRRVLVALLIVTGVALFIAWRAALDAPPAQSVSAPSPEPAHSTATSSRQVQTNDLTPRMQAELPAGVTKSKPVEPKGLEDGLPAPAKDPVLEAQYAGWSSARLEARLVEIEPPFLTEVDRLCEARFASGLYRVVDAREIEGLDSSYDVLSGQDQQGVVTRQRAVVARESDQVQPANGEREPRMEYQVVSLPPEVYPELYRQRAEVEWLRATLAARRAAGDNPP